MTSHSMRFPVSCGQDDTFGCVDDLPLKHLAAQTEAKSFLDIIKDAPLDNVDFGLLEEHMLQNKYDDLPAPFAPKVPLHKSYKMQIAIMKSSMTHCVVLKQFIFPEKTPRPAFTRLTRKVRTIDLKKWSRSRYGKLQLNVSETDEYVFYVNVGSSMCDVFHGLAMANGGACSNRVLAIE